MRLGETKKSSVKEDLMFSIMKSNNPEVSSSTSSSFVEVLCNEEGLPTDNFPAGFGGCGGQAGMLGVSIQNTNRFCYEVPNCSFSYGNACFETMTQCIEAEYSSGNFNFPSNSSSSSVVSLSSSSSSFPGVSSSSSLFCDQDPTDGFKYKGNGCPEYEIPNCSEPVTVQYPDGTEVVVQGPRIYEVVQVGSSDYPSGVNPSGCMEIRCGKEVDLLTPDDYANSSLIFGTTLIDVRLSGNSSSSSSGESLFCCGVEYTVNECGQLVMRCPDDPMPELGCNGGDNGGGGGFGGGGSGGGGEISSSTSDGYFSSSSSS